MEIQEGRIKFRFADDQNPIKFDDTPLYSKFKDGIPEGKGVDFITISENKLVFIEVKDFRGSETEITPRQRIICGLRKGTEKGGNKVEEDSLDIEVSQKIAHTFACLYGANTFPEFTDKADVLKPYFPSDSNGPIEIILFLEGDFGSITRPKKIIMQLIQDAIRKRMDNWIYTPKVRVVDSKSCPERIFQVTLLEH